MLLAFRHVVRFCLLFAQHWRKRLIFELIDLLVDRAEPALLPKTSLKSDQTRANIVWVAPAHLRILEK